MKRWLVDFAPDAQLDAAEIAIHLAEESEGLDARFLDAVHATATDLKTFPRAHSSCAQWHPSLRRLRRCTIKGFPRHLLFFEVEADGVWIIRVLHGAQDLVAILTGKRG